MTRVFKAFCLFLLGPVLMLPRATAREIRPPRVLDENWKIERVAAEPQLVTPISCRFDGQSRLLVVESHTHFPPNDYRGPKTDRIYLFDQFGTGREGHTATARQRLFHEGEHTTMGLAVLDDGWVAVTTRSEVFKIRDTDDDGVADQRTTLLRLKTKATYPHDGLGGLALGPDGWLYVGQGENLGEDYELLAADGSRQIGGGEGGNIFRCTGEGARLQRVATGFWNPFGLCFDPAGRLWTVGNDPDARPPCRLLHIATTGDYGFQFRFGRAGTNPLLAWNGELPGTLPMTSGTGEAPCAVRYHAGRLWVTSWGSNRIERYAIQPRGASWVAEMEVVVQGDAHFRPVDIAVADDGSLWITDWVDRSYPVHGQGRLWRLSKRTAESSETWPELTVAERRAKRLESGKDVTPQQRLEALSEEDPFICQAAIAGLCQSGQIEGVAPSLARGAPGRQVGILAAWRWLELNAPERVDESSRSRWIDWGLQSAAPEVQLAAIRWAAERDETSKLPQLRRHLERGDLTAQLFSGTMAAIAYLDSGGAAAGPRDPALESLQYAFAADSRHSDKLRALAIEALPAAADRPSNVELAQWVTASRDRQLCGDIVRLLAERGTDSSIDVVAAIAQDASLPEQVRADAVAGLSKYAARYSGILHHLGRPDETAAVRSEARRMVRRGWGRPGAARPPADDIDGWDALLGAEGDVYAGRRVFFRSVCAKCHAHSGRGSRVGPDLTEIAGHMTRRRLLESILQPSREVAPLYVPWRVQTTDGRTLTGMRLEKTGAGESMIFLGAEGDEFQVPLEAIQMVEPSAKSIMPDGLEAGMSLDELRDLVTFLSKSTNAR